LGRVLQNIFERLLAQKTGGKLGGLLTHSAEVVSSPTEEPVLFLIGGGQPGEKEAKGLYKSEGRLFLKCMQARAGRGLDPIRYR